MIFIMIVDWIMREVEDQGKTGIQWRLTTELHDLDYADGICLLSQKLQHMQAKTNNLGSEVMRICYKALSPNVSERSSGFTGQKRLVTKIFGVGQDKSTHQRWTEMGLDRTYATKTSH